jgi:hypothetical protein
MPNMREYFKNKKNEEDVVYKKRLFVHKLSVFYRIIILIVVAIAIGIGVYVYFKNKVYTEYNVDSTVERTDTASTVYKKYLEGILKYNNDGASYMDYTNKAFWNQTFEMQNPMIDICQEYVAIADKEGSSIYLFNRKGLQSEIKVTQPIEQLQVASQGVVYVVLDDGDTSWIYTYDKEGNELAKMKQPMTTSGYPMDVAVSDDGEKLGVSFLRVDSGVMESRIGFFNFGSVGQNVEGHLVSAYSYENTIFPDITYINATTSVAFGDNKVGIYKGTQRPEMVKELEIKDEIKSIHNSEQYFGLVYENADAGDKYRLEIYDLEGKKVLTLNFNQEYSNIVMDEGRFVIISEMGFSMYDYSGLEKFHYDANQAIQNVILESGKNKFVVIDSDSTEVISLKLN